MIIALDAGHGGRNRGASNEPLSLFEPTLTLEVAHRAASLMAWSPLIEPVLVREGDYGLTLDERNGVAERAASDAVVSIHFNKSTDPTRNGGELYYKRGDALGRSLGVEILAANPQRDWRTWIADHRVPGAKAVTKAYSMPCALVEFGFLSNSHDSEWIKSSGSVDTMAAAIVGGCAEWAKLLEAHDD